MFLDAVYKKLHIESNTNKEQTMRKRIFEIIEMGKENDKASKIYDIFMLITIVLSLIPLTFKNSNKALTLIDQITVFFFIIDYLLRLLTADFKYKDKSAKSFLKYPFSFMAIIDFLSIIPSFAVVGNRIKFLKALRSFRLFKIFRIFKVFRYSKNIKIVTSVISNSKDALITVCSLAIGYVIISALIIFNVEPNSFENLFEAIYWATVSLTTMGYGDIYPITNAGRIITMISSFMGIAIVALPSGIITAGYMDEILKTNNKKNI